MVFFNYSTMQMHAKVVYYGPGLCGKTTNLQYIYDHTGNDSRGEMVSLATETDRTLFFDLLPIDVGKIAGFTTRIQLYTVPGQVFYNTTRKLVLKGVDGVVFVADSQRPMLNANVESFENLEENLAEMGLDLETIPVVLQYNKRDLPNILTVEELDESLKKGDWASVEASALNGDGVFETLKTISKATLIALKNRMTKGRSDSASKPKPAAAPGRAATGRAMPAAPPPRKGLPAAPPPKADKAKPADEEAAEEKAVEAEEATAETTAPESQDAAAEAPEGEAKPETKAEVKLDDTVEAEPEVESVEIDPDLAAAAGLKTTGTSAGMDPATGEAAAPQAGDDAGAGAEGEPEVEAVEIEAPPELEPVEFETDEPAEAEPVAAEPPEAEPVEAAPEAEAEAEPEPEPVAAEPEPVAAAPEPQPQPQPEPAPAAAASAAAAAPAPQAAKKKKRRGGVDVLAELEKLRKQTLDPRAARAARVNGRQEVRRELDLGLGEAVSKARRFSLTLQVEDDEHRALLAEAHQLTVDIDRPGDVEQLMLRLHIALRSSG